MITRTITNSTTAVSYTHLLTEYGIFGRIALPLAKPGIATLVIFTFVNIWNDFMGPLIYLYSTELKTVQLGIRMFISQYGADYALIMAASVCSLVPVVAIFTEGRGWPRSFPGTGKSAFISTICVIKWGPQILAVYRYGSGIGAWTFGRRNRCEQLDMGNRDQDECRYRLRSMEW